MNTMGVHDDDSLLRRVASLSPERRAMISALLDEPPQPTAEQAASRALTPAEQSLLAIWEQVLGTSGIGVHDDFFAIGGDSIAAMRVAAKAQKVGLAMTVRDLVTRPTIAELASSGLGHERERSWSESRPIPLTPAQWHAAGSGLLHHGSMTDDLVARVPRAGLRGLLDVATNLFRRHDSLRVQLRQSPVGWELIESDRGSKQIPIVDLGALPEHDARLRAARLERALAFLVGDTDRPLCRSLCWHTGRDAGLLLAFHRWCADDESMEILRQETTTCLRAFLQGHPAMLPPPRPFSRWATEQADGARPDVDRSAGRGGRLYRLQGRIEREVALPVAWKPGEPETSPSPIEQTALLALARSHSHEVRVMLAANARTDPELRDAVGYYVRSVELLLSSGALSIRVARPDASTQPALGLACFFRQPLSVGPSEGERCSRAARANRPAWSAHPLEIRNHVEPGRWRTVWRFDEAIHAEAHLSQRCDVFLAEITRLVAAPAPELAPLPASFAEADLSSDELDRLLAG